MQNGSGRDFESTSEFPRNRKSKILVLTPRYPYPVVGGDRLRIYQLCRALSADYKLTLVSLCDSMEEINMKLPNDGIFEQVERIFLPKWRSWMNCALALPSKLPLQIAYYKHSGFQKRIQQLMGEHDAVLAHLIRVGDVVKSMPGIKFLEMTDAISLNYQRVRNSRIQKYDFRSFVYMVEAKRLKIYEKKIIEYFDHSFIVSEIDRQFLFSENMDNLKHVTVASNGVDFNSFPYQFNTSGSDIVFIGNMTSLQNFDAALYMALDILPLIRLQLPHVRLRLIGRIKEQQKIKLSSIEGVDVTGEVLNVVEMLRDGAVGVCPLRLGAGVQNKVLEYMALGLPVVSTTLGLEGFSARNRIEIAIADNAVDFASEVLALVKDRKYAASMAKAARNYIENHHSWDSTLRPVLNVINNRLPKY